MHVAEYKKSQLLNVLLRLICNLFALFIQQYDNN